MKKSWPVNELQQVPTCPVCSNPKRRIQYQGLIDNVANWAPGEWTSWECFVCECSYLDPRPSQASIHLAYGNYHTHQKITQKESYSALSPLRKLRRRLVNGYTNWRFSTNEQPSLSIGLILWAIWPFRLRMDKEYRHLPAKVPTNGRLLDVGCASGAFLLTASTCGWLVTGVDPDPKCVANAQALGLNVYQGGVEIFERKAEIFDVITISHVIEHVHEPSDTLADIYRLLKPGGQLWLETPNIESIGHNYFRSNWRGLEPPRHLVVFSPKALRGALIKAGFSSIQYKAGPNPLTGMISQSHAISKGVLPGTSIKLPMYLALLYFVGWLIQLIMPQKREFILIVAHKNCSEKGANFL